MVEFNIPMMTLAVHITDIEEKDKALTWLSKGTYLRHLRHNVWKHETKMLLNMPGLGLNCSCRMYLIAKKNYHGSIWYVYKQVGQDCPKGNNIVLLSCGTSMKNSELRYVACMHTNWCCSCLLNTINFFIFCF